MFEAIFLLLIVGSIQILGEYFHISALWTMSLSLVVTLWALSILLKLKAPFLPSDDKKISTMLDLADIQSGDVVYELGSGDGRILRKIQKFGPRKSVGYELSPALIWYSRFLSWYRKDGIVYRREDLFVADFSDADVILCFLMPAGMKKIQSDIRPMLSPGTKLVSNIFALGDIVPDKKENGVYLYIKG